MSNEVELTHKIMVILLFLNLLIVAFGFFAGSFAGNNPSLQALNGLNTSISTASRNLAGSFSVQVIAPIMNGSGNLDLGLVNAIPNILITLINFIAKIIAFFISLIILLGYGIYLVIFLLFSVIPSMLTFNLGALGYIFNMVYLVVTVVIVAYAFYIITSIIGRFLGVLIP